MKCPSCHGPQRRSETMLPGLSVMGCRNCNAFVIEGDDRPVQGGPDAIAQLRVRAKQMEDERRMRELIESDISDSRWEQVL